MNYSEYRKLKKADPLSSPVSTSKKSKSAEETKPRMTYSEYRQQQKSITNPIALVQTKPAQPIMQDVTPVAPSKEFELKYSKYFVPDTKIGNPTSTSKINLPVNDVALNKDEQDWLNDKKKVSNAKAMEQSRIEAEQMAEQNPLLGSAVSVFGNAAGSAVAPIATIGTKLTGKEIDPNSPAYRLIQQANAARQGTKTGLKNALGVQDGTFAQKAVDFGVDTGLSMAETVVRSLFMSPIAGATQAGLSAASRRLVEAKQNGADDSRALASAVAQGVAEEFFEKFSLEGLRAFRTNPATGFKAVLKNIAKQSFTEGSEEFFTDWANAISDYFIMGGDSEWKQSYNNYLAHGMSEEEAIRRTFVDTLEQSALSFLGGAVSGGVLGGGVSVMNLGNNARVGSEMNLTEESLNDMAESVDTEKENYTSRNAYKTAVETQQMYQELARRVANGETLSNAEKGATLEAAMNLAAEASGNHVEKTEVSSLDSSIDAVNRAENTFKRAGSSENVQNVPSIGQRAASFPESVRDTYINGFNDNINSNDDIITYDENMRKVYEAGLRGDPIASLSDDTSFMDFYNSSESAADSVDAMWIKGAEMRLQNSRSASTIDTNTEVNNNGRQTGTNLSDEERVRILSERSGKQDEGIRRGTEEVREIWRNGKAPADAGSEALRFSIKKSAAEIIPGASKNTYIYPTASKTKAMETAESSAKDYGLKVVSWGGGEATYSNGKSFRGMTIPGTDTIYAQADNPEFSQDRLVKHEIAENKLSKAEFESILSEAKSVDEYAINDAIMVYQAFTNDDEYSAAKELMCDANGMINQFRALADENADNERLTRYADILDEALEILNPIVSSRLESKKQSFNKGSVAIETNAATERKLKAAGIAIDHETNSVFSYSTWNRSQYVEDPVTAAKELSKALGISQKKARSFIDDISGIAKMIASDKDKLAYTESGLSPFVSNSEYGGSFDFDTSCTKRRVFAGTFTAIQNALPNTALTSEEVLQVRRMMDDAGFEVPCGKCYVEGSRASMGQFTKRFLELYKKYYPDNWQPNMAQANTPDGIEWIRLTHPECYEQYQYFWNHYGTLKPGDPNLFASQQKPKLYMAHSAYTDEILKEFKNSSSVIEKNVNGGIRFQSFSDFEIIHAIDGMQAIMDMSRVGLAGQAYTKQPNFARAFGNTGLKINLSIDAWSVDENGNLIFNNKEGMPFETAMELRDKFSKNVGTICCVYDDKMLLAALADDRIDFIIPFHRSQWKKAQYKAMGLPQTTKDYTNQQNEKWLNPKDHTHEYRGRQVPTKCTNYMPNEYWDFSKSGKENAEIYLQKCFEDGKRPKFYKFLDRNSDGSFSLKKDGSTDGYWKLLIDFKMYDNNGVGSPQMPVRPNFEMDAINQMLTEYEGGHHNYPVAQGIVDEFVDSYKDSHKGVQFSSSILSGKDSDGNILTNNQKEFFKDSKVVDDEGNLTPVYHGTPNGGFTTFRISDEPINSVMSMQGAGYYFTDERNAKQYTKPVFGKASGKSELFKVYLNITNPMEITSTSEGLISDDQMRAIMSQGNYAWAMKKIDIEKSIRQNRFDASRLQEMTKVFRGEKILSVMKEVLGYDGVRFTDSYGDIWVAWDKNQIKSTTNENPTNDNDIRFSSSITAGMTDEERYNILKDKTINIVESVPAKITNDYKEALSKANTSALARKLFVKLATDFGLKKEYSNSDINLKFNFSRNDVEESVTKQNKNNISDLMLLFTCLDDVVSNAVGIEVHNRNDIGYKKNEHLMAMYVLAGAFSDGDRIIPVKLEVKEFDTNPNSLYVAIALESIKKDDIFGSSTDETSASNPPSSTYKLADLFKNINASDRSFVKYIPIQFRTQENSSSLTAGLSSDEIRSRLDNIKELNSVGSMGYPHASEWQATRVGDNKEPMRLSDINKMIEQQLGINVTVGHIRKQGVRGNYNNVSHGIRTRVAMDLPTISHEVGHWFDYKYGKISQQKLTQEVQNELKAALGSLAGSYPARLHYVEGTAEFFREYLTNSVEATNKYPNATKYFLSSLSPRDLAIVTNLANEVNAYYALGAENAQGAIRLREDGGMDFRTIREKMKDRWDGFYQKWVSSNQAIRNLDRATGGNAYIKATNAAYADAIAANIIEGNLTDIHGQYVGPGLGAALDGVNIKNKKEYMAFNEYLVCKHGSEWLADGKRVFADDRMNTTAFMNKRVAELDKQYPQFKAAQARLVQFIKDFNQTWGVNTGLVDQKLYDALNKKYPNYVPFYRALEKGGSRGAMGGFANQMNPYRRAKGSGLDIIAPVDNVFEQIATMVNAAIRNDVMLSVRNAAQDLGAEATFLEKVAAPMVPKQFDTTAIKNALSRDIDIELNKNGVNMDIIDDINAVIDSLQDTITQFNQGKATGNIVSVLVKGKKEFYKINDPMLLESLTHMTSAKRNGILGAFATITRFMTANITGNNVIWGIFSNAPRDFQTFAVYSKNKNPMKGLSGFAEAYKNSVKDFFDKDVSPLYSEYLAMGGGHSSVYANDRNLAKDARKALVDKSGGNRLTNRLTALAKRLANPINWASMLTDTIEMGPRFATYKMCREMGMNPETAFYEAMDITVNFRRGGVYSKEIGKYLPFFNAAVQGLDKHVRYFSAEDIANPKRRAKVAATRFTTFVAVSALVGMLQWLINSRDDDSKKNYAQLSTFIKNSYFPFPLGDGKYFVIPKSRELGSTASAFANAFELYANGNKHAFDDFYTYAADNFLPDVASQIAEFPFNVKHDGLSEALGDLSAGILGAPFFGPFVDIRMNRDFLGRPIISSSFSYKSVEPRDVFTDNTSKIAYWIGQGLNYEPVKIDYLGNNILGYIWKYPSALIGNVGGERDLSLGVKNSYIKDNLYSQDLTNWMYDQREKSERAFNSDEDSIDKKIVADLDDDMTSFYSNFNKLNKANTNQSQKRTNKQLVMDMIAGYRAYKDGGTNPSLEAVKDVIRDYAESGTSVSDAAKLLPDVMEVTVKSQYKDSKNKTVKGEYSLTDKQYYDFQADYNAQYYSFIEQNLKMSDPLEKKVGVIEAAKEAAKNNATLNMLKKLGARTDAKMTDVETVRTKAQEKAAKAVFEEAYNSAKENDADGHFSSQEMYQLATDFAKKNSGYNAEELYLSKAGNAKKTYDKYTAAGGTWDDFDDYLEMQSLSGEDKQEKIMDYLQNSNWSESTRKKLWEIAYESEYGTKKAEYGY